MISCELCNGACCRELCLGLARAEDEELWLMRGMRLKLVEGRLFVFSQPCENLDERGRCKIYEIRPERCRRNDEDAVGALKCMRARKLHYFNKASARELLNP